MLQPTTIKKQKKKNKGRRNPIEWKPRIQIDVHGFNSHNNNNPCNLTIELYIYIYY